MIQLSQLVGFTQIISSMWVISKTSAIVSFCSLDPCDFLLLFLVLVLVLIDRLYFLEVWLQIEQKVQRVPVSSPILHPDFPPDDHLTGVLCLLQLMNWYWYIIIN